MSVCTCGHHRRMHEPLIPTPPAAKQTSADLHSSPGARPGELCNALHSCRACRCSTFTPAADPDSATEAARSAQLERVRLLSVARRALREGRWAEAQGACAALARLETTMKED